MLFREPLEYWKSNRNLLCAMLNVVVVEVSTFVVVVGIVAAVVEFLLANVK